MNGSEGEGSVKMEVVEKEKIVYMWGYLPGAVPQRSPLLSPVVVVRIPQSGNYLWKDVCGGGCGFAMAISGALSFPAFPVHFWVLIQLYCSFMFLHLQLSMCFRLMLHCLIFSQF